MLPDSPELLVSLFALAVFAGVIHTMAGGGGLLVVPGLMAAGLDPSPHSRPISCRPFSAR